MKLHSPRFQKNLKRGVKKAIRESRELKKEYRRAKKGHSRNIPSTPAIRVAFTMGLGIGVFNATRETGHPATGLAIITLWSFAWVFLHASGLWLALHKKADLEVLRLLPI